MDNENNIRQGTVTIDGNNYHLELTEEFENSYYRAVYKEAYSKVNDIINRGRKNESGYDGEKSVEFPNIITFIGGRGDGKTSVMRSFMKSLKDYYRNGRFHDEDVFYELDRERKILFTCLECIDGSLMERGEDVFKTILAQMYQKFTDLEKSGGIRKDDDFDFRKRELLKGLENIYRTVCAIETMEGSRTMSGEAYMNSLQSFSSSQKVRKDFVRLIRNFTDLMAYKRDSWIEQSEDHYVVIAIDDIDLNIHNSFFMLEKIERYCTVPNVIVLLTLDMQQILSVAYRYFYEVVPKVDKLLVKEQEYVRKLATDYLEKTLPIQYRISVPSISTKYSLGEVVLSKEIENTKKALLGKIYRRTGVCFDSQGVKRHFYEPNCFRELAGLYLFFDALPSLMENELIKGCTDGRAICKQEKVEKRAEIIKDICDENYYIIVSDLENRLAVNKLPKRKEFNYFRQITRHDIRRAMTEVSSYCEWKKRKFDIDQKNKNDKTQLDYERDKESVSYGELVEAVYDLGRIKNKAYKPLVHCLLAYFSYAFTKQYIMEKLLYIKEYRKQSTVKDNEFTIEKIVGGNILCNWADKLLPELSMQSAQLTGLDEEIDMNGTWRETLPKMPMGKRQSLLLSVMLAESVDANVLNQRSEAERFEEIAQIIRKMEFQVLCFANYTAPFWKAENWEEKGKRWKFVLDEKSLKFASETRERESFQPIRGDFNVLNIISSSMCAGRKLALMEKALVDALKDKCKICTGGGREKKAFLNILAKYSLKTEYEKWEAEFGGPTMPLPIWWFDFSYNVLKRMKRNREEMKLGSISDINEMHSYTKGVYECLLEQLKKQQDFYSTSDINIARMFEECPAVKVFLQTSAHVDADRNSISDLFNKLKNY